MDFKLFSHWLCAKKQSILLQHMHEKDFFILTNKCETISVYTKTRLRGRWAQTLSLVFVLKLIPTFIGQNNTFLSCMC
jgi:hypothetical protein